MEKCIKEFELVVSSFMKMENNLYQKNYTDLDNKELDSYIMFRMIPWRSCEMTTLDIKYRVRYEFTYSLNGIPILFNSCPCCKSFTKVYTEDYNWTENKILNEWKEIYQKWLDIKNEPDKNLKFKKLTNLVEIQNIDNDFN